MGKSPCGGKPFVRCGRNASCIPGGVGWWPSNDACGENMTMGDVALERDG